MNTILHKAETRGHANHGWLDSHHTFSFAHYYDSLRVSFGALRVLNDDIVQGGRGFGKHPHDNMEIVSIPLQGALAHSDTTGKSETIKTGDVQIMSAGSGLAHAEFNASATEPVNFLQIWVFPKLRNIAPRYEQKSFNRADRLNTFQTVVAPDDAQAVHINQDAWFSMIDLTPGNNATYTIKRKGNGVYIFVIEGSVLAGEQVLNKRDGLGVSGIEQVKLVASADAQVLLIEVPMNV